MRTRNDLIRRLRSDAFAALSVITAAIAAAAILLTGGSGTGSGGLATPAAAATPADLAHAPGGNVLVKLAPAVERAARRHPKPHPRRAVHRVRHHRARPQAPAVLTPASLPHAVRINGRPTHPKPRPAPHRQPPPPAPHPQPAPQRGGHHKGGHGQDAVQFDSTG